MKKRKILALLCATVTGVTSVVPVVAAMPTVKEGKAEEFQETAVVETKISFDTPEKLENLTNIALGKHAESNLQCYESHPASEATDGEYDFDAYNSGGSFAQVADASGEWYLTVDLGENSKFQTVKLDKVNLNGNVSNNLKDYQIQISEDGVTWKQLGTAEKEEKESDKAVYFTPETEQTARYVRLYSSDVEKGWKVVDEIEVYAQKEETIPDIDLSQYENLALRGEAALSEPEYSGHPAGAAIDGNLASYAQANNGQAFDLVIDLKESQTLNTAVMKWYGFGNLNQPHRIKGFKIYTSMDGVEWNEVATRTLNQAELRKDVVTTFEPVEAQYVKFEMTDYDDWMAMNELELYDTSQLPNVTTTVANGSTVKYGSTVELKAPFDSSIYYTLDGSDPVTSETKIKYSEPIVVQDDITIKAYAEKEGFKNSEISTYTYQLQWVEANPDSGMVEKGTEISLESHLKDSKIFYTTDGTDPKKSNTAQKYKEAIAVEDYKYINAYAKSKGKETPVYEFVYATENAAKGKEITASGGNANDATDGDESTVWETDANGWIKIDFGTSYDFDCVNILWAEESAEYKYVVETSSDNYIWYNYFSNPTGNNADQKHVIPLEETHRQYMRIKVLGAKAGSTCGIREIEVIGKESAPIPEIPMYDDESDLYDRVVVNPIPTQVKGVKENKISLNGEWNFTMTPQNAFWKDNTDISNWDKAKIPGDLDALGFDVYDLKDKYGGYGEAKFYPGDNVEMAYKTQVEIPKDFEGQKVFLRIDKAFSYARVWVNGKFVRDHRGEYYAWDADITDYIKPGEKNWITISITAEGSDGLSFVGLRSIRGILSDVTMYATSNTYLNRLHVETDLDEAYKDAKLTIMTNTFLEENKEADIKLSLKDMKGKAVKLEQDTIHISEKDNFTDQNITMNISNPQKWDDEHPNLYTLKADVVVDGKTVETVTKQIGFREITIEDSVFKVNGNATKLRGVNYHSVYGNDGVAYDLEAEKHLLETAKKNNVNYIRAAHYPISDKTLELCDQLGIFVEQEHSVCFAGTGYIKPWVENHEFYTNYMLHNVSEMVEKDRSHPAIVIWSIANESKWGPNHDKTSKYIKSVNPSIPVKFSWGSQIPAGSAVDVKSNHYQFDGGSYDGMPVVWDEFAHDYSNGNESHMRFDPGFRENYYQIIKQNWEQIYSTDTALGGAIWCYTDNSYEGKNRVMGNSSWGQVDAWGREKPEIWATKNVYSPVQYKGEEFAAVPEKNKHLILRYENRYETVNFADDDFEILYSVNGEKEKSISAEIEPKTTGDISIISPKNGWEKGDKVTIEFYKTTGEIRRNVYTHVVTLGAPEYVFPDATGKAPRISEDNALIHIAGDDFSVDFSKETGKIINGSFKENTVLVGGPYLNLGMTNPGNWTLNSIKAEEKDGVTIVTIDGNYSNTAVGGCIFMLEIDSAGRIETTYTMKNAANISDYEIGVSYDLPKTTETLSWVRDGYLSYYPEDQMGRLEGTAIKEHADWKREWGEKPTKPWKEDDKDFYNFGRDDQGGRGTYDFRGSKTGIHYAEIGLTDTDALLAVYGDGKGSVRANVNEDQTVRLNINNEWGYPVNGLSAISEKKVTATKEYKNKVIMQLSDVSNNYEISYGEIPVPEFIKADKATAGSTFNPAYTPEQNVINNSGMSSDMELDALHDNEGGATTMWHTRDNPGKNAWIQVDLGRIYSLDQMWVWNHNQKNLSDRGLKNVKIEYSEDGENWIELTTDISFADGNEHYPFQFAQASGESGCSATNLNDENHTPVCFDGAKARYVKITAAPTSGNGNWGSTIYGLSELRFTEMEQGDEKPVDKTILQKTYDYALTLNTDGVTDSAKKVFEKALAEAKSVLDDTEATQEEVNAIWNNLLEGIWGLGVVQGDKTYLELLIAKANDMMAEKDRFVEKNWSLLEEALQEANDVMNDGNALDEDVKPAVEKLLNAILAQRYKANKDNLKNLIDKAEGLDLSKYTKESVRVLKKALAKANDIYADESLSIDDQKKVDKATKELEDAISGLKLVSNNDNAGNAENGKNNEASSNKDKPVEKNAPKTDDNITMTVGLVLMAATVVIIEESVRRRRR